MATEPCSCDTKKSYAECCGPVIRGERKAATAVELMRSRYTAFVRHEIDHILNTLSPARKKDTDRETTENWSRNAHWEGLEILSTDKGGPGDETGTVEFIARFREKDQPQAHHEVATFIREKGAWVFEDGRPPVSKPVRNEGPKIGRNDPCPCGSGKKYKKCHGVDA